MTASSSASWSSLDVNRPTTRPTNLVSVVSQRKLAPIYKISYDLLYDYFKFIVRSSYDSDLKRAKISHRNIVS